MVAAPIETSLEAPALAAPCRRTGDRGRHAASAGGYENDDVGHTASAAVEYDAVQHDRMPATMSEDKGFKSGVWAAAHGGAPASTSTDPAPGPAEDTATPGKAGAGAASADTERGSADGVASPEEPKPPVDNMQPRIGYLFNGYVIEEVIGEGGMGTVYRCHEDFSGKKGALKFVRQDLRSRADVLERLRTEAKILAELEHPNIVGLLVAGHGYIVMEYLEGVTLREYMNHRKQPLALVDALLIAIAIADALRAAHKVGIIHRDLKPENIFMLKQGEEEERPRFLPLKVLDFGIGKLMDGATTTDRLLPMGTPHYAAPEQIERTGIDERTDIYALAEIFVEVVTGLHVFSDTFGAFPDREIVRANQLYARPNSLRAMVAGCPEGLADLIDRALSKDKEKRPRTVEFLAGLRAAWRMIRAAKQQAARNDDEDSVDESLATPAENAAPAPTNTARPVVPIRRAEHPANDPPKNPSGPAPFKPVAKTLKIERPSDEALAAARASYKVEPAPFKPVPKTLEIARPSDEALATARAAVRAESTGVPLSDRSMPGTAQVSGERAATLPPAAVIPRPSLEMTPPAAVIPRPSLEMTPPTAEPMPPRPPAAPPMLQPPVTPPIQQPRPLPIERSRESVEFENRPTAPWQPRAGARVEVASLSPMNRTPNRGTKRAPVSAPIPLWAAALLGVVMALGAFGIFLGLRERPGPTPSGDGPVIAAPAGSTASSGPVEPPPSQPSATTSGTVVPAVATAAATAVPAVATARPTSAPAASVAPPSPKPKLPAAPAAARARKPDPPGGVTPLLGDNGKFIPPFERERKGSK